MFLLPRNPTASVCDSGPLKMTPIGLPETSVRNYHYSLRNNPEERSSLCFSLKITHNCLEEINIALYSELRSTCEHTAKCFKVEVALLSTTTTCLAVLNLARLLESYSTSLVYGVQIFWRNLPPPLYSLKTEATDLSEKMISICHKSLIVTTVR